MTGRFLTACALALLAYSQPILAQNAKAVRYNNRIIKEQHSVTPLIISFFDVHFHKHIAPEVIKREKEKIELRLDKSIAKLQATKGFEGDDELRNAALDWFKHYKQSFDIDYEDAIPILVKKEKTEAERTKLIELQARLLKEEEAIDARFQLAQENFAAKYHLTIQALSN